MNRGLGWKKDKPKAPGEKPDFDARMRLGALAPPPAASCRGLILDILDQGGLGSCTANAAMQALRAAMRRQGVASPELGSRLFAYYLARAYDHDTDNDDGTFIRNVFTGIVKFGFPPERVWPYSDDTSNPKSPFRTMPSMNAFRSAFDQRSPTEYHRISTTGDARVLDVKRAIAAGHCVVFGTLVSNDFCSNILGSGPIPPPINLSIAGGHAMVIAEYDEVSFGIVGSWGESSGDHGWYKFSPEYIKWGETDDLWIVTTTPIFRV